jgi:biopolymer transport protein ExbB/TolQ
MVSIVSIILMASIGTTITILIKVLNIVVLLKSLSLFELFNVSSLNMSQHSCGKHSYAHGSGGC